MKAKFIAAALSLFVANLPAHASTIPYKNTMQNSTAVVSK